VSVSEQTAPYGTRVHPGEVDDPGVTATVQAAAELLDAPVDPDTDLIEAGANSITMIVLVGRLYPVFGPALTPALMLHGRTPRRIAALVAYAARETNAASSRPAPRPRRSGRWVGNLPITQYRMWYLEQRHPGAGDSNSPAIYRLRGALDVGALNEAVRFVVVRHEALRTRLSSADGKYVDAEVVEKDAVGEVLAVEPVTEGELPDALHAFLWRGFDLAAELPLRARLFQVDDGYVLAFSVHHTAYDGWSDGVLCRDLSAAYRAAVDGTLPELPPVAGFHAVARLQADRAEAAGGDGDYWLEHVRGVPDVPLGAVPATDTGSVAEVDVRLDGVDPGRIRRLTATFHTTSTAVYLAAWVLALRDETGADDFAIGMPLAGRTVAEAEDVIGCFASSAILRFPADVGTGVDCLRYTAKLLDRVMTDQYMPLERLFLELEPPETGRHPFCQVGFVMQNNAHSSLHLSGVEVERVRPPQPTSAFEMALVLWEGADLGSHVWYREDVVERERAARLVERWLGQLSLLCQEEPA
jgi:mycobactin peptide synthetase MbtE